MPGGLSPHHASSWVLLDPLFFSCLEETLVAVACVAPWEVSPWWRCTCTRWVQGLGAALGGARWGVGGHCSMLGRVSAKSMGSPWGARAVPKCSVETVSGSQSPRGQHRGSQT